jgi:hypothetical protein
MDNTFFKHWVDKNLHWCLPPNFTAFAAKHKKMFIKSTPEGSPLLKTGIDD